MCGCANRSQPNRGCIRGSTQVGVVLTILSISLLCVAEIAFAQEPETIASCSEGVIAEPVLLRYGDHTNNCRVSPTVDLDTFSFQADSGDAVRINVSSKAGGLDPTLEIRDPNGSLVVAGIAILITNTKKSSAGRTSTPSSSRHPTTGTRGSSSKRAKPRRTSTARSRSR